MTYQERVKSIAVQDAEQAINRRQLDYGAGCRDTRAVAGQIAAEADARIAELEAEVERLEIELVAARNRARNALGMVLGGRA